MKKRIRIGEFLVEKSIAAISFASLACIVLIFVFVFREAAPIFSATSTGHPGHSTNSGTPADVGRSESYGSDPGPSETYGDPGPSETYGDPGPSETYGDDSSNTASATIAPPDPGATASASGTSDVPPPKAPPSNASLVENLSGTHWQPVGDDPKFGLLPLVVGSLKVALLSILIAAPIGILSALFTSTFAPKWAKEIMKPVIELLAGIPSVVIGFLALVSMATLLQNALGLDYRLNALLGGVAMALAVIPIIYTLSEDALAAVPKAYTEGSLALGASPWETNLKVVLPAAIPGIFASILLGVGRAFGETMIVLMATGNAALISWNAAEPVRTISASIGAEMAEVVFGETHYTVLFLLGALLFAFSFLLNAIAEVFVRDRLMKKFGGAV